MFRWKWDATLVCLNKAWLKYENTKCSEYKTQIIITINYLGVYCKSPLDRQVCLWPSVTYLYHLMWHLDLFLYECLQKVCPTVVTCIIAVNTTDNGGCVTVVGVWACDYKQNKHVQHCQGVTVCIFYWWSFLFCPTLILRYLLECSHSVLLYVYLTTF